MPTFFANPSRTVIYTGSGTAPESDPLGNISRIKYSSTFQYLPLDMSRTITRTVSVPSNLPGSTSRDRVIDLGAHGQPGVPFIYGYVRLGGAYVPFAGSIPIHVTSNGNVIAWTLGVNASRVFIAELRSHPDSFGSVSSKPVKVYISTKLAA